MSPQLFDGAGPKGVTGGDQDLEVVLDQTEAYLGQVGALAHTVHPAEGDHVGLSVLFRLEHIS